MTGRRRLLPVAALAALLAGCIPQVVPPDYSKFLAASPRSLLVVPVVNNTVEVEASAYFLSTIPVPVAERGYYVFPINMVKRVLEDDGLSDASLVHAADPVRLCALFGADAVLYVTIQRWEAKYVVISTSVTVAFIYTIKDGKTGDTLWTAERTATYTSDSGGGQGGAAGLIAAIVSAAITKASPNYMPLARMANAQAMGPHGAGFPVGPYRPEYGTDYQRPGMAAPPPRKPTPPPAPEPEARPGW
jgi:hypothetical protein